MRERTNSESGLADAVRVIFRCEADGGWVTAVFPDALWTRHGDQVTCYQHIGQHGSCTRGWYRTTRPAAPAESANLKAELERIGYVLRVVTRWTRPRRHYAPR